MSRSHRNGIQKKLTAVVPVRPYRCAQCRKRKWQWLPWKHARQQYLVSTGGGIFIAALVAGIVFATREDGASDFAREQAYAAPQQLGPSQKPEKRREKTLDKVMATAKQAAVLQASGAPATHVLLRNGMRLTMPAAGGL